MTDSLEEKPPISRWLPGYGIPNIFLALCIMRNDKKGKLPTDAALTSGL